MAKRIQLKRTKGWRKPEGAVVVSRPSKWGNPFRADEFDYFGEGKNYPELAVRCFEDRLRAGSLDITIEDIRRELRGKDLCCWCPLDQPCHADVLLEIANAEEVSP